MNSLVEALGTHLCYGTRQRLQGQRIKAREKNKNRNKNWGKKETKKARELEERSRHVSDSRGRNRGALLRETGSGAANLLCE